MSELIPHLEDYATSRTRLLSEAAERGATISSHAHPLLGPDGDELSTDVARFGAAVGAARAVVIVASGTHGVEGHGGWGLQQLAVDSGRFDHLAADVAVVVVHAVNPYGMAWSRRVDHDNIDVNRNFVDFDAPLPPNVDYDDLAALLNPDAPDFDPSDATWQGALWEKAAELGMAQAFRAISGGQFHVPHGMQFGGQAPSWSNRTLHQIWEQHLAGAEVVINLDLHTGLGGSGVLAIFQTADEDDESAEVVAASFPTVSRSDRPGTADPMMVGVLGPGMEEVVTGPRLVVPLAVEFGTHDIPRVLSAMRADNWLHQHGDPRADLGVQIRAEMRDAFFIDDDVWRAQVADQGLATIDAALSVVGEAAG